MPPKVKANSPDRTDTSQGKANQLPPKKFIRQELEQFGTMGTPDKYFANLCHKRTCFERSRFQMSEDRFEALEQCLALSERLLAAAAPYLTNFLPDAKLDFGERGNRLSIKEDLSIRGWKHVGIAWRILFCEILPTITWTEDADIWPQRNIMGLNHTGQLSAMEVIGSEGPQEWEDYTELCEEDGLEYRHLTITLASQIIDAILASEPNTEQHMNALFAGAINITHELGHAIFLANKKNYVAYFWVGNDIHAEIGHSLVAHIFNGWYPEPINLGDTYDDEDFLAFRNGHAWHKMHRRPCQEPFAEVMYSMPMEHIQRLFNQATWEEIGYVSWENFNAMKSTIFPPLSPFRIGRHARCARLVKPGFWKRRISRSGFREEGAKKEEDWDDCIVYGPPRKEFFDADWDDAETEKDQAVQEENNRKYVIDLTDPGFIYLSIDTDNDKTKKGKGKGMDKTKPVPSKSATKTHKGTTDSKATTPAKRDTPGTGENKTRGRPARPTTSGQSSTPTTSARTSGVGATTAGKRTRTRGTTTKADTSAKAIGRKPTDKRGNAKTPQGADGDGRPSSKKRGASAPEDQEGKGTGSPKKRPRSGGKSTLKKTARTESPEDDEEDEGTLPKKRTQTGVMQSVKVGTRAKSNPVTTPKTNPSGKKPGSAP